MKWVTVEDLEAYAYERSLRTGQRIVLTGADILTSGISTIVLRERGWVVDPQSDHMHPNGAACDRLHAAAVERQRQGGKVIPILRDGRPTTTFRGRGAPPPDTRADLGLEDLDE